MVFACNADRTDLEIHSSDMCLRILHFLANDKELKRRWIMLTDFPEFDKKSSLLVLKNIHEYFVKIKQKQLTTKYNLQPQKFLFHRDKGCKNQQQRKQKVSIPLSRISK